MQTRFAVDKTLGRLAKWLRILGFDTLYEGEGAPDAFGDLKGRILLSRSRQAARRSDRGRFVLIAANDPFEQLGEVMAQLALSPGSVRPFSRCIRCNRTIRSVEKPSVFGKVPDYVWETHDRFRVCPQCRRIYWSGSHVSRSIERIGRLFARPE